MKLKIGVDIGGTFTDIVMVNETDGAIIVEKTPSTPGDLTQGVINAISKALKGFGGDYSEIHFFSHGSTTALNALLERSGASPALLTTENFIDILEIGRQTRSDLYDLFVTREPPLTPRYLRKGIKERIDHTGRVIVPLDEDGTRSVINELRKEDISAVAICFLHSYKNPQHEKRVKELVEELLPDKYVVASSDLLSEFREYERMSTTVLTAYLLPIVQDYIQHLNRSISEIGIPADLKIMHSGGGILDWETASLEPARLALSGPSAGVSGSAYIGELTGQPDVITFDMGGTSADISLVKGGRPTTTTEGEVINLPIKYPQIDLSEIGAGGGSIARVDSMGKLKVGPQSAGARPGPICYGNGGENPTVTDAHLILGRLSDSSIFRGERELDFKKTHRIFQEKIADPLGMDIYQAALGVLQMANDNMMRGIKTVTIERGYNPKEFSLIAFGGAGPMHAVELARGLDIPEIIIPTYPGVLSALGLLTVDVKKDFVQTAMLNPKKESGKLKKLFEELVSRALQETGAESKSDNSMRVNRFVDARYVNQNFEIPLEVQDYIQFDNQDHLHELVTDFHLAHERIYGHKMENEPVEIVNLRCEVVEPVSKIEMRPFPSNPDSTLEDAVLERRKVYIDRETGFAECTIYGFDALSPGMSFDGPGIVEQPTATAFIPPGYRVECDRFKNLIVREK